MKHVAFLLACLLPACVRAAEPAKTFEVASIKPSAPAAGGDFHGGHSSTAGPRFGPGTPDATRWVCDACSLGLLVSEAYNLKRFQISGPAWLDSERFDVAARVAEGASKEDLRAMQRNLLAERFGLKARLDKKETQVYDLVVGKNPPKLKPASATPAPAQSERGRFAGHSSGRTASFTFHGITRHQAVAEDMPSFADWLAEQLDRPVIDSTGLSGNFDFLLTFSGGKDSDAATSATTHGGPAGAGFHAEGAEPDALSQPPLRKALQDQLGLRLEPKKGVASILIVDHIDKLPSAN